MNDKQLGKYLASLVERRRETRNARVQASLGSNRYTLRDLATGQTFAAEGGQNGVIYAVGKLVTYRTDAPSRGIGSTVPTIIAQAQGAQNGVIVDERPLTAERTGVVVTQLPTLPAVLVVSGTSVAIAIYGAGLTAGPTYGDANITNESSAVVRAECVTAFPKAGASTPKGMHTLTIAGVTIADFFEVT